MKKLKEAVAQVKINEAENMDAIANSISNKTAMREPFVLKWLEKHVKDTGKAIDLMQQYSKSKKWIDLAIAILNDKPVKIK